MKGLTDRQQEIFDFIHQCMNEEQYIPTLREIADRFGYSSPNAVRDHLAALEKKGYILRRQGSARGIEIAPGHRPAPRTGVPIIGRVAAGSPITAVENLEGYLDLADFYSDRHYALHVRGDSMIDAGIWDGDFAIVREQTDLENGAIGVAIVEGEATVKRIVRKGHLVELIPANDLYRPFQVNLMEMEFRIGGKVVGIHRVLRG